METRIVPLDPPPLASQGDLKASRRIPVVTGWSRKTFLKVLGVGTLAVLAALWTTGKNDGDQSPNWRIGPRVLRSTVRFASDVIRKSKEGESSHDKNPQSN